jgi:hypothetical protein
MRRSSRSTATAPGRRSGTNCSVAGNRGANDCQSRSSNPASRHLDLNLVDRRPGMLRPIAGIGGVAGGHAERPAADTVARLEALTFSKLNRMTGLLSVAVVAVDLFGERWERVSP